ncbi:aldehyde dehydrogenase family protein [Bdellovibrio sp. NC01]|uniref:aldehyde dehydrogenase family protein n=1 Tax=Bdellovibrio sp. NC01 TaxID=2220073 RepID=UPI00115734C5|nr:aldehyde dehydrogenase family protein [Bdellovibrio sp. NC01]QDK36620.1 aldehyde dehydrogenase [Bdellovibrio sp. NC01]
MEILNFIGGEFVASDSKKSFSKKSPFDGSALAQVTESDAMDVIKSLQAAKKVLPQVEALSVIERAKVLSDLADYLESKKSDIARLEALHQGLPKSFVLKNSVEVAIAHLRATSERLLQPLPSGFEVYATGIIGVITSWCLSLRLITERLAPAMAAGNVVIVKVSEHSPITAVVLGEALKAVNAPAGWVQFIQGKADVAQIVAGHPSIRAVTAVGRNSTMEAVAKAGLTQFKKLQLSAGAKNGAAVLSDFDYATRMPEVMRSFMIGQGQMCWNTSRLFLIESFHKEFNEALHAYMQTLEPLQSPDGESVWTPLISEERAQLLAERTSFGVSEHGKVIWGQQKLDLPGNFVKPTWMLDLPNCSVMQQDELHAPLFLITSVKYQHEILKWANTSYLGHSAVLWGGAEKVQKVATKLECAHVFENSWMNGESNIIFGHKQSSFGNLEMDWKSSFYSDGKKLTGI